MRRKEVLEKAQQEIEYWKKILQLTEWDIDVRVSSEKEEEDLKELNAYITSNLPKKCASVVVDIGGDIKNLSKTILHELLHLKVKRMSSMQDEVLSRKQSVMSKLLEEAEEETVYDLERVLFDIKGREVSVLGE